MTGRAGAAVLLAAAVPLALFLVTERRIAGAAGFPLDDAWIHLHFARNIAEGHGFAYNPGSPVSGSTAPLWTLVLAAGATVFGASVYTAKVIGMTAAVAAAIMTATAVRAWGGAPGAAAAAGTALLWTGAMGWGGLSGMEVPLTALLVAATLAAHGRDRIVATALFAALAVLARPEALILIPLLVLARPLSWSRLSVFGLVTAAVLAPAVAFSLATVGAPLPATAAAKVEGGVLGWLTGVHEPLGLLLLTRPRAFLAEWIGWLWTTNRLLPIALLPALAVAAARAGRRLLLPALALIVHPFAMAILAPYRGPAFQEGRYSAHLLPVALVVLAVALGPAPGRWRRAVVVAWLALALVQLPAAAVRYAWGVQNINAMQVHLGHWVDAHVPRQARLALNDIGAIAFFSRREVIDLMGLVTPAIIPYRREGEAGVIRFVRETCPDYVIVFPTWFPEMTARRDLLQPVYRVRLQRNEVAGGPEMVVYRLRRCAV